jgi:partner of Y14 and mago protein
VNSIRKERKVKPGFTPAEDVRIYRPSRVLEAQQKQTKSIPGYEPMPLKADRKATARTTLSSPATPSRADGDWRKAPPDAIKANGTPSSSNEKASTSSSGTSDSASWRRRETVLEKVPDDWEEEEEDAKNSENVTTTIPSVDVDKAHMVVTPAEGTGEEESSSGKVDSLDDVVRNLKGLGMGGTQLHSKESDRST